ncbi:MAG: DUF885 domain-containing protein, partial [candidate division Zixibacteria bacterium]|nr:DUF885 domain-containing protein [candidate division Zixibacteria bacterium]
EDLQFKRDYLDSLGKIDPLALNESNRIDYQIMSNGLKYSIFRTDTLKTYEWNPRRYNPGGAIYQLIAHDFAPLAERLKNLKGRLEEIPKLIDDAKTNLKNPPKIYTETALLQIDGTISLIRDDLNIHLEQIPKLIAEIKPTQHKVVEALEDYKKWLQDDLLPRSNGDFRLGDELFRLKLRYALDSDISKEELLERAEQELEVVTEEMFETAVPLFKKYYSEELFDANFTKKERIIKMVLDKLADEHPTENNIVDLAKEKLRECEDFVRENKLVTLFGDDIDIVVMPEFERGVAIAYCNSPGPLEENGETFYAIAPPPQNWDSKRVESYFREYNNHMLVNLTVHEAMPGHYLHATHSNRYNAPTLIRSIYGSGTFTEGWATYTEQLMVEYGFGGAELKMQMLKMRLRMVINVILDQKIHTAEMTEDEAMDLMINKGFQEDGEAAGKWRRACLSSTQLSTYYMGNIEINDIRKDYQKKAGDSFDLMAFHDELLSYGRPAPKYLRQLMNLN